MYRNKKYSEKLLEQLGQVNDSIIADAYLADTPEKLQALKQKERCEVGARSTIKNLWLKAIAVTASLAITFGIALGIYISGESNPDTLPWNEDDENVLVEIDSIDALNYYAAKRVLTEKYSARSAAGVKNAVFQATDHSENLKDGGKDTGDEDTVYYEFDPTMDYSLTKVIFFKAELKNPKGFLAGKLGGIGVIDVVISESSLETMITFKRGSRYYSCLLNSYMDGMMEFSTHKYIEGFHIVKKMQGDNFSFFVKTVDKRVVMLDCDFSIVSEGEWKWEADRISVFEETSRVVNTNSSFKIWEIENYFNSNTGNAYVLSPTLERADENCCDKDRRRSMR
ncbi:MAG: hypothetical protein IKB34_00325 [Clostridia bacterium]|nr:hypothetical protein [Clostridia bacterium]